MTTTEETKQMSIHDQVEDEARRWKEIAYNPDDRTVNLRALFPLLRIKATYAAWRRTRAKRAGLKFKGDNLPVIDARRVFTTTRLDGYTQAVVNCFLGQPSFPTNRTGIAQINVLVPAEREAEIKAIAAKMIIDYLEI